MIFFSADFNEKKCLHGGNLIILMIMHNGDDSGSVCRANAFGIQIDDVASDFEVRSSAWNRINDNRPASR